MNAPDPATLFHTSYAAAWFSIAFMVVGFVVLALFGRWEDRK